MKNRNFEFRDFIYNFSDIITAVLIILIALLIIAWRVNAIMEYPQTLSTAPEQNSESVQSPEQAEASGSAGDENSASESPAAQQEDISITIQPNQTVTDIAQILLSAGAISDTQQFIDAVDAAGAATMLKYGTYSIPAGATPAEIVQLLL